MTSIAGLVLAGALHGQDPGAPLLPRGIGAETRGAIDRALVWLARSQNGDGCWRHAGGYGSQPVAMTGLAGMALLASGSTPTRGPYWREVRKSMQYLIGVADRETGLLAERTDDYRSMYGHGFATLYLASLYGMEEDERRQEQLQRVLNGAVRLIERSQSASGGWNYQPGIGGDEGSVTITQVQALRACRMAGITVDRRTVDAAVEYIARCQNRDGGIRYRAGMQGPSLPAITAAAVASLYSAGVYDDQPFADRALRYAKAHIRPTVDTTNHHFYAQLYFAQALYQSGGADWDRYLAAIAPWLAEQQLTDGSWEGDGVGPVYGTAIALVILQLPYALVPIYQR